MYGKLPDISSPSPLDKRGLYSYIPPRLRRMGRLPRVGRASAGHGSRGRAATLVRNLATPRRRFRLLLRAEGSAKAEREPGRISEARTGTDDPKGTKDPEPAGGEQQKRRPWSGTFRLRPTFLFPRPKRRRGVPDLPCPAPETAAGGRRVARGCGSGEGWKSCHPRPEEPAKRASRRTVVGRNL
jgi:hypothetical protein